MALLMIFDAKFSLGQNSCTVITKYIVHHFLHTLLNFEICYVFLRMMSEDMAQPEVHDALSNGKRRSAATIEHTEVHVDMSGGGSTNKRSTINTGRSGEPEVRYSSNETGQTTVVVQTKPDPADKPKDFVVTSCFVIMFCNFIWGIAGWHFGRKFKFCFNTVGAQLKIISSYTESKLLIVEIFCQRNLIDDLFGPLKTCESHHCLIESNGTTVRFMLIGIS